MPISWRRSVTWAAVLLYAIFAPGVNAGGGVLLRDDTCIITIGFYTAHFTAYQPETQGSEEFCEDLPDASQTLFVLDYLHASLKDVPVDFRIVTNMTDLGRFARWEHLQSVDLEPHTVFYEGPTVHRDARLSVEHRFETEGEYIGVVTAGHPTNDSTFIAVFPFEVGKRGLPVWAIVALALGAVGAAAVWRWRQASAGGTKERSVDA